MMRLWAFALLLSGCIDTVKCHTPEAWTACAGSSAEPGASGMPPAITSLMLPSCASVASPAVSGSIAISDPDGDTALIKTSIYVGARVSETETMLPLQKAKDFSGAFTVVVPMAMPGAYDVRVKAVDRAGGQSAVLCDTVTILQ